MSFNFKFTTDIVGKKWDIKEPSFFEYKNLAKSLMQSDMLVVEKVLNDFLVHCCGDKVLTASNLEKFLLLLKIRSLVLGDRLEFIANDASVTFSVKTIIDNLNKPFDKYEYYYGTNKFVFNPPSKLLPDTNPLDIIYNCLYSFNDVLMAVNESANNLPALPLSEFYTSIFDHYNNITYTIPYINLKINLFDDSMITFSQSILQYNLKNLYDLEYSLRRNLNLNSQDFATLSLPECEILIKSLKDELAQIEKAQQKVDNQGVNIN